MTLNSVIIPYWQFHLFFVLSVQISLLLAFLCFFIFPPVCLLTNHRFFSYLLLGTFSLKNTTQNNARVIYRHIHRPFSVAFLGTMFLRWICSKRKDFISFGQIRILWFVDYFVFVEFNGDVSTDSETEATRESRVSLWEWREERLIFNLSWPHNSLP